MCLLQLPVVLLLLSAALNTLKATPIASDTDHRVDKRKCNTATCATQRLTNFLVRSSHNLGAALPPTKVGSNTYGRRNAEVVDVELLHYLPL
ncbi:islet amyloid polypeptide isoform X1 [Octodon degus]|uniref:Islet amyloid polypeptide n=2 Tax=Octodon degus TaxID=10160 RepID=IAPP_OCTDE|nr:islet amyloid polypeptide precursor [Octodon degus]XP_023574663.1 islet amyloid polypeptide isoform X1 [Octodon degus]P22889.1 RecName: Full=Islet amyloid polypeptide; AltName: Full=Amylin; Flags: Precursor [Octodon degus]AAA40589.1 islet amyloid polypeptide [Octodon degus]